MHRFRLLLGGLLTLALAAADAPAEDGAAPAGEKSTVLRPPVDTLSAATANEHPLAPALKLAYDMLDQSQQIKDYSCKFVLRERMGGELKDHEYLEMKVRHEPFSVYVKTLHPKAGEEVIYVEGRNDGLMWGHTVGQRDRLVGAILLDPLGSRAMQDRRHPITDAGMLNLGRRIVESGTRDLQYGECEVEWFEEAKINDRPCTCVEVVHPQRRKEFQYHKVRIYVDQEWRLPVRYESYGWPREEGDEPPLLEEYTFTNLRFNNGFTDRDFDPKNPAYKFRILEIASTTMSLIRSMSFAALVVVMLAAPTCLAQQGKAKPSDLPSVDLSGTVAAVKPGYIQVSAGEVRIRQPRSQNQSPGEAAAKPEETNPATDDKKPPKFVIAVHPQNTTVSVNGTSEAKMLKPGMFVRFSGKVDKEEKVFGELTELEVFTPAADFKPKFDVKLPPPKFATDEPAPETLSFEAEGPIAAIKAGELTAVFFDNRRVKVKLAKDAKVKFTIADYAQAREGDVIRVKGKLAAPGQVLAETVSITLADRKVKKEETVPADDFAP